MGTGSGPCPMLLVPSPYLVVSAHATPRAKLAFFDLGGVQLELIQPIGEDSAWAEGLRDREGFHHLAFWTEDMHAEKAQLGECDIECAQRGDMGPGQYAYFDAANNLGTWIELLQHKRPEGE
ncbi:hypothetical protein EON79_04495 [bacterium]|nr:MAG: hypothetical protein EON79_04495 [bacterium]